MDSSEAGAPGPRGAELGRWGGAIAFAAAALGLNFLLQPAIGHRTPLLPFVPVAALAGYLLGVWPALLSVVLFLAAAVAIWTAGGPVASAMGIGSTSSAAAMFVALAGAAAFAGGWARHQRLSALATRARYDAALEATGIVEWECSLADGSMTVSPSAVRVFGRRPENVDAARAMIPPDDLARMEASVTSALDGGGPLVLVHRIVHQGTGEERWIESRALVRRDATGRATHLTGYCVDVTAQQRLIDDHIANEERLRLAAEAAQLGIWWTDLDAGLTYCTARKLEIYGLPGEEGTIPDSTWLRAIHPDDLPGLLQAWQQARSTRSPYRRRYRIVRPDGTVRWVHTQATFIEDRAGRPRVLGVSADVTAEYEREQAEAEASRRKDEFLATLAHELRNPLAPIRYASQLLQHGAAAPRVPEIGRMIERQLRHMARLLDDLMDVSRITRGTLELRKEPIELGQVVTTAIETFRAAFDRAGQALEVEAASEPLPAMGDPVRVLQIVENLLSNANRYTDPGGRIRVTTRRDATHVVLEVVDNGMGMPPDRIESIFEPFTQLGSRGRAAGGLGIGLALARRLADLHGGELRAHSDGPGTGTRMTLRLPLGEVLAATSSAPARNQVLPQDLRVLVVDDNRDAAEALGAVIEQAGAQHATAFDGFGALAMARAWRPDVVLLDLGLPDVSGFEVARELGAEAADGGVAPRLVAISGWGQPADVQRGRDAGIEHHFVKPVEAGPLLQYLAGVQPGGIRRIP